nr:glycosyl hydrolase [uncultured Pedobacter sp.]
MKYYFIFILLLSQLNICHSQSILSSTEFKSPPVSSHVHTWWHWISGNITKDGITRDLESMKKQGISQATILNVGGFVSTKVDVPQIKFNSPEWYEMFHFALKEANRLGITIGVHNSDGWSTSGGPWISEEMSMKTYVWSKTYIQGESTVNIKLEQPQATNNYYRDYAVIAFPTEENANSFAKAKPEIYINNRNTAKLLFDGNPKSKISVQNGDIININFTSNFTTSKIALFPYLPFTWSNMLEFSSNFVLSSSIDGNSFSKITDLSFVGLNKSIELEFPETKAKFFRLECKNITESCPIGELELMHDKDVPSYSPQISNMQEKTVSVSALSESCFDKTVQTSNNGISKNSVIDLTNYVSADGVLNWKAPKKGKWCIIRFGYTTTGVLNAPATPEGLGLECDKMDSTALNNHFKGFSEKLIHSAGNYKGNTFKFLLIDSWEAQFQNWTKKFPNEFLKLRGYEINKWLPVLCGFTVENTNMSEAFLHDYRKTISDLIGENYYKHFSELCHKNGLEMHAEVVYGGGGMYPPLDVLKSNKYVDLPMTEFWADPNQMQIPEYTPKDKPTQYFPAYSALINNQKIIGAEAYTGFAHYSESPSNLKAFGDLAYCSGVNQLILHSYVHQPIDKKPGLTLGKFGGHFNRNNPWWEYAKDWLTYQSRIQYVLQKGEPIVDVIFYIGDNLPQNFGKSNIDALPNGYRANPCDLEALMKAKVKDGKISFGGNQLFPLLVLPDRKAMNFTTLKKIAELVSAGAVIYGPKPNEMNSVLDIENHSAEFNQIADALWGNIGSVVHTFRKGKVFSNTEIGEVLKQLNVVPDFESNVNGSKELLYIHKRIDSTEVYFVFNQQNKALNRELLFRVEGRTPEIWNPKEGVTFLPEVYSIENNRTRIPVSFEPKESMIFVFRNAVSNHAIKRVSMGDKQIFPIQQLVGDMPTIPQVKFNQGKYSFYSDTNGDYQFTTAKNKVIKVALLEPTQFNITNYKAKMEFLPISKDSIKTIEISQLKSLTEFEDPAIKYFAGKVKYTIKFSLPKDFTHLKDSIMLNLGDVGATAEVLLNGNLLGDVWLPNSNFNVTGLLKKENTLNITLATICRNRFIGDLIQFDKVKSLFTTSPIETILNKEMPLVPSGIMGPLIIKKYHR